MATKSSFLPKDYPSIAAIKVAKEALGDRIVTTPVWRYTSNNMDNLIGADTEVFCKLELFQYTGSFKPRGALLSILNIPPDQLVKGVVAASAGNHAIAVSYAAQILKTSAKVIMPKQASPMRIARCRSYGAEVLLEEDIAHVFSRAQAIQEAEERYSIHPFEGPFVALGTATLGLELCEQVPDIEAVIIPIGGGGLCGGIAAAIKQLHPQCLIFGVEPEGADTMKRSFTAGSPQAIPAVNTIADSLGAPYAMPYSFALCRAFVDEVVLVDDQALCNAMLRYFNDMKLAVEPAAAASLAALCGPLREKLQGKRVALIVSGTNIDTGRFCQYIRRAFSGDIF
jgi:threonine dehydratase